MRISVVSLMSRFSSYRSDADVFHVQLIATLVKVHLCVCVCMVMCVCVCVNHWRWRVGG